MFMMCAQDAALDCVDMKLYHVPLHALYSAYFRSLSVLPRFFNVLCFVVDSLYSSWWITVNDVSMIYAKYSGLQN